MDFHMKGVGPGPASRKIQIKYVKEKNMGVAQSN